MPKSSSAARTRRRRLLAASVSVAMVSSTSAQAFERVVIGFEHFIDCAGLLLSDTEKHAQECLPNNAPPDIFKWESDSVPNPVQPPPPVPVAEPIPAPAPVDCGPTDCGPTDCGPTDCGPTDCGPTDCGPSDA